MLSSTGAPYRHDSVVSVHRVMKLDFTMLCKREMLLAATYLIYVTV